jgi:hypothetical protein
MTAAQPTHSAPTLRIAIRAAGGLVIRRGADDGIRVDAIAWLRRSEAALRLTHDHDRELLDAIMHLEVVLERREEMRSLSLG